MGSIREGGSISVLSGELNQSTENGGLNVSVMGVTDSNTVHILEDNSNEVISTGNLDGFLLRLYRLVISGFNCPRCGNVSSMSNGCAITRLCFCTNT
jgi:hypothetical protein